MGTKEFNILDKFIAYLRYKEVLPFIKKRDKVLDFGCGYHGTFLKLIQNRIEYGVGIDYELVDSETGNLKFINYYFSHSLPFKANTFNKVCLLAVIEHLTPDLRDRLIKEIHRVLSPKGLLIITPTPKSKPLLEFLAFKLKIISQQEIADHKIYYDENKLSRILHQFNFVLKFKKKFLFGLNGIYVFEKK